MGIPKFYGEWIVRQSRNPAYRGLRQREIPTIVSALFMDLNGLIHNCAQMVYAYGLFADPIQESLVATKNAKILEAELFTAITTRLSDLLFQLKPRDSFVIAIDGSAPISKILQQRSRRYRAAMSNSSKFFDSNCITPGTSFMERLDEHLTKWLESNRLNLPRNTIYSGHLLPGEGEHKILEFIRAGKIQGQGANLIYGLDADLTLLALVSPLPRMYLVRENLQDIVSIDALKNGLNYDLNSNTAITDFVLMMSFLGNDFINHIVAFSSVADSLDLLFEVYRQVALPLTNGVILKIDNGEESWDPNVLDQKDLKPEILWENLVKFIHELARHEERLLSISATKAYKYPSRLFQNSVSTIERANGATERNFHPNRFRELWYKNEFYPKGGPTSINVMDSILSFLPPMQGLELPPKDQDGRFVSDPFNVTDDMIIQMVLSYLQGIGWVYTYYLEGKNAVQSDYIYPYFHAPLLIDISNILTEELIYSSEMPTYRSNINNPSFDLNPVYQLLAVIPPKSKKLIDRSLHPMYEESSPIFDMFPTDIQIERDGTNDDWAGILLIPPIQITRIVDATQSLSNVNKVIERLSPPAQGYLQFLQERKDIPVVEVNRVGSYENQRGSFRGRGRYSPSNQPYENSGRGSSSQSYRGRGSMNRGTFSNRGRGSNQSSQPRLNQPFQPRSDQPSQPRSDQNSGRTERGRGGAQRGMSRARRQDELLYSGGNILQGLNYQPQESWSQKTALI